MTTAGDGSPEAESFDCIIVGAGISGINCAFRLKSQIPNVRILILESRGDIGGTWDQWKYPGVRCDSEISTIAFPWHNFAFSRPIVSGDAMQDYLRQASAEAKIDELIRLNHKVSEADWSRETQRWHISADHAGHAGNRKRFTCRFFVIAAGFLDFENPPDVKIPHLDQFKGKMFKPATKTYLS